MTYFKCEPGKLCEGAKCCNGPMTAPVLLLSDYYRLSQETGKPMHDVWLEDGDIILYPLGGDVHASMFVLNLSLFHEPCPYNTKDFSCSVYANRPTSCLVFPLDVLHLGPERLETVFKNYRCMQGLKLKPEQRQFFDEYLPIGMEEQKLDLKYVWKGQSNAVSIVSIPEISETMQSALCNQERRDPDAKNYRSRRLMGHIEKLLGVIKSGEVIHRNEMTALLGPLLYSVVRDELGRRIESLDSAVIDQMKQINEERKALLEKFRGHF